MNIAKKTKKQAFKIIFLILFILSFFINIIISVILFSEYFVIETDDKSSILTDDTYPPKYIFLFIGDGFGYPQMTLASQYKTTVEKKERGNGNLVMLDFDVTGIAFTGSASSIIGDSAASATAMASGLKTYNAYLNYDIDGTKTEIITEKLKKQLNYRIGIISSVNLNQATPAAFYAHQNSRYENYGGMFLELLDSDFDFFGGGSLYGIGEAEASTGKTFWELLSDKGYTYIRDKNEILNLKNNGDKIIAVAPKLDIYGTLHYAIDYAVKNDPEALNLADLTRKCIELLDNDTGFYMMVEGGKIDLSCHANDAATLIHEVIAFDEAINEAVEFYKKNPRETLIIVTGDHETGGLSLGYSGTYTNTYLQYLQKQKISYSEFARIVAQYRQNETPFDWILPEIEEYFGISQYYDGTSNFHFYDDEIQKLRVAYEQSLIEPSLRYFTMNEYILYGFYDPLTTTITNITNKKAGVTWGTFSHSFSTVPVFAMGNSAELFRGVYHNSEIFYKLKNLMNLE